jgi:23S rRNA (uracil1939-C5)-methyltransferase
MGELTLRSEAEAFVQVNTSQAERLYAVATEWAGARAGVRALDLYSGAGGLALTLAKAGAEVRGVELSETAVAAASRSATETGLSGRCRFAAGDAAEGALHWEGPCDVVTLNPPRAGAEPAVLDTVIGIGPERVVYVSCNPETLARDAGRLIRQGYRLCGLQPVDMFPHTGHVEVVARFEKVGSGSRDGSW